MGNENFFNELGNIASGKTSNNGWTVIKTESFEGLLQDDVKIYHVRVCTNEERMACEERFEKDNEKKEVIEDYKKSWEWDAEKKFYDKTGYYHKDRCEKIDDCKNKDKCKNIDDCKKTKKAICLHWTAGSNAGGAIKTMAAKKNAAVSYIIDRDGTIYSMFDDCYYASHLGPLDDLFGRKNLNAAMSQKSIAIEIVSMGHLKKEGSGSNSVYKDGYKGTYKGQVKELNYEFRKHKYIPYVPYVQIKAVCDLLFHLMEKYKIPNVWQCDKATLTDSKSGMFKNARGEYDANAALNFCGVYSHSCVRKDKLDWPDEVMKEFKDSFKLLKDERDYYEAYLTYRTKLLEECGYTPDEIQRHLHEELKNKICSLDMPKNYSDTPPQEKLYSE